MRLVVGQLRPESLHIRVTPTYTPYHWTHHLPPVSVPYNTGWVRAELISSKPINHRAFQTVRSWYSNLNYRRLVAGGNFSPTHPISHGSDTMFPKASYLGRLPWVASWLAGRLASCPSYQRTEKGYERVQFALNLTIFLRRANWAV